MIDSHSHVYPKVYLKSLMNASTLPRVEIDPSGSLHIVYSSFKMPVTDAFHDVNAKIKDMDRYGIDLTVLSLANPWTDFLSEAKAVELTRKANDEIYEVTRRFPDRFIGLATLPFQSIDASLEELDRTIGDLQFKGVIMGSNIAGKPLHSEKFIPILARIDELGVPVSIHPTAPSWALEEFKEYGLTPVLAFVFDTTLALTKLILSGIMDKLSSLKLIVSHTGGALPYLAGRIDEGYKAFLKPRQPLKTMPSEYIKKLYVDAICYIPAVLKFIVEYLGSSRILFGTDHPFKIGGIGEVIDSIKNADIDDDVKAKIFHENALEVYNLKR